MCVWGGGGLLSERCVWKKVRQPPNFCYGHLEIEKAILKDCVVIFTLRSSILCTCVDGLNNY